MLTKEFACLDIIYINIESSTSTPPAEYANLKWVSPYGNINYNKVPFNKIREGFYYAWDGLRMYSDTPAMIDLLGGNSGMEQFIGKWRVEVEVGQYQRKLEFKVLC